MTFTLGIYIKEENIKKYDGLKDLLNNPSAPQTEVFVYHDLDNFKFHNMVFIDCEFNQERLNQTIDLINDRYQNSRQNDYPLYMFVYLFTDLETTKQCTIIIKENFHDDTAELDCLYHKYGLHEINCPKVQLYQDIRHFADAPSHYVMGYWGYIRYGTHKKGKL